MQDDRVLYYYDPAYPHSCKDDKCLLVGYLEETAEMRQDNKNTSQTNIATKFQHAHFFVRNIGGVNYGK